MLGDKTNSKVGRFKLQGSTISLMSDSDAEFSATIDTGSKINVYTTGGFVTVQNKLGSGADVSWSFQGTC